MYRAPHRYVKHTPLWGVLYVLRAVPVFGPFARQHVTPLQPPVESRATVWAMEALRTDIASRVQLHRQRQKSGRAVLTSVEVGEDFWTDTLVHCGLLDPSETDDRKAMSIALSKWLAAVEAEEISK
jgi:hypothetical protein